MNWEVYFPHEMSDKERFENMGCLISYENILEEYNYYVL